MSLTDPQRKRIHDLALTARELLTREAQELLEGTYGLYPSGRFDPPEKLPQVQTDPEAAETYRRLKSFIADEVAAGLARDEAVEKLVKEVAFTHLNRLAAFKMMEARRLIRGTLDKGTESNAFKFYLADPEHAADYALHQEGQVDAAYRHFLLWQAGQVAGEIKVLFDPDTLPSRLFPRPRALNALLGMLNDPELVPVWQSEETVGWIYQYFNEPELQAAFAKVGGGEKFEAEDIPSATQLFTPNWIVRYLVQNTLGRLWTQMHPDTRLIGTALLDYLVPQQGEVQTEPLRPVKEIALLDPACGGMHFGLVAFDLFHAMYMEELERAGEPGWPETPSVSDEAEIPAVIISHNLFGIDIDLRAVQLSALALYLKAKSYNKDARLTDNNLAVAGVLPSHGARLGAFLREARFTRPVYERLLRALWERLRDARQLGSLLRLEKELADLVETERKRYEQAPLFAGIPGEFEATATDEAFWRAVGGQIVRSLHEFAREQAQEGEDQTFFVGEAVKGMRLLELMLRDYDVVVTNPPYMNRRKMNGELAGIVQKAFPEGKSDLYAAFIQRCLEFARNGGYVGMLTMHSFMFISSYESLREEIRQRATIATMAHCGPALFDVGNPGTLQTTAFVLRADDDAQRRPNNVGSYFRLVHAPDGEGKRLAFEQALRDGSNTYHVAQKRFDVIPGRPWAYWVSDKVRDIFEQLPKLADIAQPVVGLQTGDNFRFLRFWWEVGLGTISNNLNSAEDAKTSHSRWFPHAKGGVHRWYKDEYDIVNWYRDGIELKNFFVGRRLASRPQNTQYYFKQGIAITRVGPSGFTARLMPGGHIFDSGLSAAFPTTMSHSLLLTGVLNSTVAAELLGCLNPTLNFQVGDVAQLPIPIELGERLISLVVRVVRITKILSSHYEANPSFIVPRQLILHQGLPFADTKQLRSLEDEVDSEVSRTYGLTDTDFIKGSLESDENSEHDIEESENFIEADETQEPQHGIDAIEQISYAVGIILGRFQPGIPGALGSAVYRRSDFAIGSLPEPTEEEFDELVGPGDIYDLRFTIDEGRDEGIDDFGFTIDEAEGRKSSIVNRQSPIVNRKSRHVFSREVEQALRELAVPDGITVLDAGHPRDLPALVERALRLMLGDKGAEEVIAEGAGGNLRKFLERDYFTKWHMKWYRSRPVYWPLQSAKRSYGFVLFHEKVDNNTLFVLQRDYLDHKLNGLRLHIEDLRGRAAGLSGAALKRLEREIDKTAQLLEEINEFAATMARLVQEGYQPQPNWIDDGIILRLAPLWELMPIWKAEPRKYWQRLQEGQYDWSHIAMNYWPERVREACQNNKSFAIAHGL